MAVYFHAEEITYQLREEGKVKDWIGRVIEAEAKQPGVINVIFTSDSYLLKINNQYLDRDYFTDIITFDYSEGNKISGDLYLSMERIRENAKKYRVTAEKESLRIIVHGILHLIGYNDQSDEEKRIMTEMENKYLEEIKLSGR